MKTVSLKYDYLFKYLMQNPVIRRHFVSDVLEIPMEEIQSVSLGNPYLWKKFYRQKQGILDILLLLNNDRKINIELQIRIVRHWDRRALFYLAKMFTEDLLFGEKYAKLKKCISISILDFNLNDDPEYHRTYLLRDRNGKVFSDLFEVHVIELRKKLDGDRRVDDWIRLFNAETEEELDMIKTENLGIITAIREIKAAGLGRTLKALYDGHMKQIRDQYARDEYVRDEGIAIGEARGEIRGRAEGRREGRTEGEYLKLIGQVRKKALKGMQPAEAAEMLEEDLVLVSKIYKVLRKYPGWNDERILETILF